MVKQQQTTTTRRPPIPRRLASQRRVTTFTATERGTGFHVMMAGCMQLHLAAGMPRYVRGTVVFQGRNVPVIDLEARAGRPPKALTDDACVVLFARDPAGRPVAGALYRDIGEVLELVRTGPALRDRDRFWAALTV